MRRLQPLPLSFMVKNRTDLVDGFSSSKYAHASLTILSICAGRAVSFAASVVTFSEPVQMRVRAVTWSFIRLPVLRDPLSGMRTTTPVGQMSEHYLHIYRRVYGEVLVFSMGRTLPVFLVLLALRTYALYNCSLQVLCPLLILIAVYISPVYWS
jgi:hypothetical protein